MIELQLSIDGSQLTLGDGGGDTAAQTRDDADEVETPLALLIRGHRPGDPDLRPVDGPEAGRHDADDRVRLAVDAHERAGDAWIAVEQPLPHRMPEHDDVIRGCEISLLEGATECRRDIPEIEEPLGDFETGDAFGQRRAGNTCVDRVRPRRVAQSRDA